MERKTITLEEAYNTINWIVDRTEDSFHNRHSRFPSLINEEDYVLLGDFLNIQREIESRNHSISGEDVAFNLIRRFLDREGHFNFAGEHKTKVIDGMLGRLHYNVPAREYENREANLREVLEKGLLFPPTYENLVDQMGMIKKVCFLKSFSHTLDNVFLGKNATKIPNERNPTGEKYEKGYRNLGTHFVNPSGYYSMFLKRKENYQDFIKEWEKYKELYDGVQYE